MQPAQSISSYRYLYVDTFRAGCSVSFYLTMCPSLP